MQHDTAMDNRKSIQKTYYGFLLVKKNNGTICGRYPLTKKECTIGRDINCDLRILLDHVSAQHCIITYIDDKAFIRDKSIAGTTKVNGKKVGRSNFLLNESDEIEVGGRKFEWLYARESDCSSGKKSAMKFNCMTPRSSTKASYPLVPQDNDKISQTPPVKSNMKTLVSFNKTPIVLATTNMSKLSFEEVKESLKNQNSNVHSQSEPRLTKSYSMVSGRNIPLIGNSTLTPRKSWVITNTEDISSGVYNLNKLSSERSKIDSTPEYDNTSYHYEDENVEFDSPVQPFISSNDEYSVNVMNTTDETYNLSLNNPSYVINTHSQSNNLQNLDLSDSECESHPSRRNTYSIDGPIVIKQNTTPAPRRSILKCSKTTVKPNRSRPSCRMVQFARLPRSDSRIKILKSRFNSGFNFVITDDEVNNADISQDSRKVELEAVEFDDDLDGVRPLDSSVSSLINSPILENPVLNKSSKRGSSRGNKVMSLISSFEKRTNESPKHSIRASDLLTLSGLKYGDTSLNNDLQNNTINSQESVCSARRVNLENIFEAEDSLKNLENEMTLSNINENSLYIKDITSSAKKNLNDTDSEKVTNDTQNKDTSENIDCEYNSASPLNLCPEINATVKVTEKDQVDNEVDNLPIHELNNISNLNNTHKDEEENRNEDVYTDHVKTPNIVEDDNLEVQNNVSKSYEQTSGESPSMIVQYVSDMFNNTIDELQTTNSQNNIDTTQTFVMVEKDDIKHSKKSNGFEEIVSRKSTLAALTNNDKCTSAIMDNIEARLSKVHGYPNSNSNENNEKLITSDYNLQDTVFDDSFSDTDSVFIKSSVKKSSTLLTDSKSIHYIVGESTVFSDMPSNTKEENNSQNLTQKKISNLNNSKHTITKKSSKQLNKSNLSEQSTVEYSKTRSSKKIQMLDISLESDDLERNENMGKTLTNSKRSLNKSNLSEKSMVKHGKTRSSKMIQVLDVPSESHSDDLESNENINKTLNNSERSLNNSKHIITKMNSKQLNKSNLSEKSMVKHGKTRSSKMIQVLDVPSESHSDDLESNENINKTLNNSEQSLDNSKHTITKMNSEQLNKSNLSEKSMIKHGSKTRSSKMIQVLDVSSESHSDDLESNENINKTLNNSEQSLNNSKHTITKMNSEQLNKSNLSDKSMVEHGKTRSSKKIQVLDISSEIHSDDFESNENINKTHNNSEQLIATIGIPQFESTPWNSSKSSKGTHNSTFCVNTNETTRCIDSESGDKLEENTPPTISFPEDLEIWSQMMKDFNESVKKASFTQSNITDVSTINKDLFNQESKSTENRWSLNNISITNNSSKVEKNNTLQCSKISSCLSDNNTLKTVKNNVARKSFKNNRKSGVKAENSKQYVENENNTSKSSIHDVPPNKNGSICIITNNKTKKQSGTNHALNNKNSDVTKETITLGTSSNTDSDSSLTKSQRGSKILIKNTRKTNCNQSLPSTRRNLRVRGKNNESRKSNKKHVRINVPDETSENCDTDNMNSSGSENASISEKQLRLRNVKTTAKSTNDHTTSIKQKDSQIVEKTSAKIKPVTVNPKKIALPIKTRSTRSNKTLIQSNNILKLVKKSKSPIKTKSAGAKKIIETIKPIRSTRYTKVSESDSLEDESVSETKQNLHKPQISVLPKAIKGRSKKKDVLVDTTSTNPTNNSLKEKNCATSLNNSPQIRTRGCKRTADTLISAPNAKGSKYNNLSTVTSTTSASRVSNSPQSIRHTRNTSKSTDVSFLESTVDKSTRGKPKLTRSTRAKKLINPDDSSGVSNSPQSIKRIRNTFKSTDNLPESTVDKSTRGKPKLTRSTRAKKLINPDDSSSASRVSNSPQSIKRTRNTSKSTDNSFPESTVDKSTRGKPKLTRSTRANKRINSDDSSNDSLPSDRKKARKTVTSSIKTSDTDNEEPSNNAKKRLNKDVVKESISSKPTKTTRNTKQQPVPEVNELPAPRVLRLRQKKQ